MSYVEGMSKEERKVCPWQQFIHTENGFCISCYFGIVHWGWKTDNLSFLQS